jgi:hypothetical protein
MAGASAVQAAKRALVVVLRSLAAVYSIMLEVNRDSPDDEVKKAFKRVAAKAHPDKGGATEDSRRRLRLPLLEVSGKCARRS